MSLRILVVDDMRTIRLLAAKALGELKFKNIITASNGKEAYDTLVALSGAQDKSIELVVSDWNMEPVNGLQLLKMVRHDKRIASVLFTMLTAESLKDNIVAALKAGADAYIIKPFTTATVKTALENLVAKKVAEIKTIFDKVAVKNESDLAAAGDGDAQKAEQLIQFFGGRIFQTARLAPWSSIPVTAMGVLYQHFGKHEEAESYFRQSIKMNSADAEAQTNLSNLLRSMGKL